MLLGIAVIWTIFQIANDRFLSAVNLSNLSLQIAATATISIGVVLILLLGEIDLSVGAVSGLAAAVMAVLSVKQGWSPVLGIAAGLAVGLLIGIFNGFMVTTFAIPSFVVTLAGLLGWQGAQLAVLGDTGSVNLPRLDHHRPDVDLLRRPDRLAHRRDLRSSATRPRPCLRGASEPRPACRRVRSHRRWCASSSWRSR